MRGVILLGCGDGLGLLGGGPSLLGEAVGGGEGGPGCGPVLRLLGSLGPVRGLPRHAAAAPESVALGQLWHKKSDSGVSPGDTKTAPCSSKL